MNRKTEKLSSLLVKYYQLDSTAVAMPSEAWFVAPQRFSAAPPTDCSFQTSYSPRIRLVCPYCYIYASTQADTPPLLCVSRSSQVSNALTLTLSSQFNSTSSSLLTPCMAVPKWWAWFSIRESSLKNSPEEGGCSLATVCTVTYVHSQDNILSLAQIN